MTTTTAAPQDAPGIEIRRTASDYAVLKQRLTREGLFERSSRYYVVQASALGLLLAGAIAVLILVDSLAVRLLDAILLAVVFTQIGYIGHDAGHRQIFRQPRRNDQLMLLLGTLTGTSGSWWRSSHNQHHSQTNRMGIDPHTAIPALAFSEAQAREKTGALRLLTRYQAFYFYPMLLLEGFGIRIASVLYILSRKARNPGWESLAIGVHLAVYAALLLSQVSWWQAALFIGVHQGLMGLYMGSVFAPNHKGMLVIEQDSDLDFLRHQVLTTRNIKPHPLTDIWYGGLNYQIEHHLFPNLPRRNLKRARGIVKEFCRERGVSYHETGLARAYVELTCYLHGVVNKAPREQ